MAEFKIVISHPKKGRSLQKEIKDASASAFIGKKIGDVVKGDQIELPGYEFEITGGSDFAGFPMRKDVTGTGKKKITAVGGVGIKNKLRKPNPKKKGWRTIKGMRLKKTVAGNTVYDKTAQINVKILKEGKNSLFEDPKPEVTEEPKEAASKEEPKKEEPKKESADKEPVKKEE